MGRREGAEDAVLGLWQIRNPTKPCRADSRGHLNTTYGLRTNTCAYQGCNAMAGVMKRRGKAIWPSLAGRCHQDIPHEDGGGRGCWPDVRGQAKRRGDFAFQPAVGTDADGRLSCSRSSRSDSAGLGAGAIMWVNSIGQIGDGSHWPVSTSPFCFSFLSAPSEADRRPAPRLGSCFPPAAQLPDGSRSRKSAPQLAADGRPPCSAAPFRSHSADEPRLAAIGPKLVYHHQPIKEAFTPDRGSRVLSLRWIIHPSRHPTESPAIKLFTRRSLVLFRFGTAPARLVAIPAPPPCYFQRGNNCTGVKQNTSSDCADNVLLLCSPPFVSTTAGGSSDHSSSDFPDLSAASLSLPRRRDTHAGHNPLPSSLLPRLRPTLSLPLLLRSTCSSLRCPAPRLASRQTRTNLIPYPARTCLCG